MAKVTKNEFIERSLASHKIHYDYSKVNWINTQTKVIIICLNHGEFSQQPTKHMSGQDCPICAKSKAIVNKKLEEKFFNSVKLRHNNFYNYNKSIYVNAKTNIEIICPIHGSFWQTPDHHLNQKSGCSKCAKNYRYTNQEWIEKAKEVWKDVYTYDKSVDYKNAHSKLIITCKIHGDFEQEANSHLQGCGCPKCFRCGFKNQSILFDKLCLNYPNLNILYEYSPNWLERQRFDVFIPSLNIAIEYNGKQHYEAIDFFGGDEVFQYQLERDDKKRQKCRENNCILFELKYDYNEADFKQILNLIDEWLEKRQTQQQHE